MEHLDYLFVCMELANQSLYKTKLYTHARFQATHRAWLMISYYMTL